MSKEKRDIEKSYPVKQFVQKLRRLARLQGRGPRTADPGYAAGLRADHRSGVAARIPALRRLQRHAK